MPLFLLRLRAWYGWGQHPDVLRARSARLLRPVPRLIVATIVIMAALVGVLVLFYPDLLTQRYIRGVIVGLLQFGGLTLLFMLVSMIGPAIASAWLARLDARTGMRTRTVYGCCFAIRLDPPGHFFARIGLTRDTARWYNLPLGWDDYVTPSQTQVELEVLPASGWVERLRVLGSPSCVLTQAVPEVPPPATTPSGGALDHRQEGGDGERDEDESDDGEMGATEEEERTLRQFARRADLGWKTTPANVACAGWAMVIGGAVFALLLPAVVGYIALTDPRYGAYEVSPPGSLEALDIGLAVFGILGLALMIWGFQYLRVWRRLHRLSRAEPITVSGEVLSWLPYRDIYSPGDAKEPKETLIDLRLPDGQTHIFRVPTRFLHRVRQRGQRLRIAYVPTTERVLDVVRAEAPVEATQRSSEQG